MNVIKTNVESIFVKAINDIIFLCNFFFLILSLIFLQLRQMSIEKFFLYFIIT